MKLVIYLSKCKYFVSETDFKLNKANLLKAKKYFDRNQNFLYHSAFEQAEHFDCAVIIPCYSERWEVLKSTLQSLHVAGSVFKGKALVLIVFNAAKDDIQGVAQNSQCKTSLDDYLSQSDLTIQISALDIHFDSLKDSGVGYARKLGMDSIAMLCFSRSQYSCPLICLDADTVVAENYFVAIQEAFEHYSGKAFSIHFEHILPEVEELKEAIIQYELHLRYFIGIQRFYGLPFAYQTIGSAMACSAQHYVKVGGMVKRQAGEDFYFMHKFSKEQTLLNLNSTTVFPSSRISQRVPFGTGKAVNDFINRGETEMLTYHYAAFEPLDSIMELVHQLYGGKALLDPSQQLHKFLIDNVLIKSLDQLRKQAKTFRDFHHSFFQWFNAFRLMKYVHSVHETSHKKLPLNQALCYYFELQGLPYKQDRFTNLEILRKFDKKQSPQVNGVQL